MLYDDVALAYDHIQEHAADLADVRERFHRAANEVSVKRNMYKPLVDALVETERLADEYRQALLRAEDTRQSFECVCRTIDCDMILPEPVETVFGTEGIKYDGRVETALGILYKYLEPHGFRGWVKMTEEGHVYFRVFAEDGMYGIIEGNTVIVNKDGLMSILG